MFGHTKLLPIAVVMFSLGCTESRAPEDYPDAVSADPDHYSVEFENDAVRLLRIAYGPGEESVMHYHPEHCGVALSDASWRMTDNDGAVTENTLGTSELTCNEGAAHAPENSGSSPSELILIEFKEGAMAGTASWEEPDAVTADPDHYSVEYENDVARIIRIRYESGETSVMHRHPANCIVWIVVQQTAGDVPDPVAPTVGQVTCSDSEAHLPSGGGDGPVELILLELKGRETVET